MATTEVGIRLTAKDQTQGAFSSVGKSISSLQGSAAGLGASLAGLGAGISAAGFLAFTKAAIDSIDALNDLKDATGASIENISALENIARRTGTSFDTVGSALVKLNQTLANAKPDSDAARALEKIGLSVKNLKDLDPAEAFRQIAVGLSGFADDGNKARISQELFGKSLKEVAPLLNDVAAAGALVGTVTAQQAQEAENLNKQLFSLQANALDASRTIASEFLPTLNAIGKEFLDASGSSGSLATALGGGLKTALETIAIMAANVAFVFSGVGREIGSTLAQIAALGRLDFKGFSAIAYAVREDGERARKELDDLERRILGSGQKFNASDESAAEARRLARDTTQKKSIGDMGTSSAAAKSALTAQNREIKEQAQLLAKLSGVNGDYIEQLNRLQAVRKSQNLSDARYAELVTELIGQQPMVKELYATQEDAAKAATRAQEDQNKALDKWSDLRTKESSDLDEQITKKKAEVDAIGQTTEAVAALTAAKYDEAAATKEAYSAALLNASAYAGEFKDAYLQAAQDAKDQAEKLRRIARLETDGATKKSALEAVEEWKKAAEKINDSITDALMRGFESGKGFAENLRDTVVNMFKTMVLRPVISAIVNPVAGALTGALGLSGAANAATSGLTSLGLAGTLNSIYTTITGGFTAAATYVADMGVSLGGSLIDLGLDKIGTKLMEWSTNPGAIGGLATAGGALAGYGIGTAIGGDYSAFGSGNGNVATLGGTAIGALFGGPVGAAIGGAIGGLVNRAFGQGAKESIGSGITGSFSGSSFSGQNFTDWRREGGWFSSGSSGTDYSDIGAAQASALGTTFAAVTGQISEFAKTLGLSADTVLGFTKSIRLSLTGDAAANQAAITAMFKGIADEAASTVLDSKYIRQSETAASTLQRLSVSIVTVNAWLSILQQRLLQVSLAGGNAASELADAFGGLENLSAASKTFYELFYSNAERLAGSQKALTEALASVNLALPESKEAFRALADTLDLSTASGRAAYVTLLKIAPEFAATADLVSKAAKATSDALIKAFTGNGVVQSLDATALSLAGVQAGVDSFVGNVLQIRSVMLDTSSPIISFNGYVKTLSDGMTGAQASAITLNDQIEALSGASNQAVIDFAGLGSALLGVNYTPVFAAVQGINTALSGIDTTPVGTAIDVVNSGLTSIDSSGFDAAIAGVGQTLSGVSASGVLNAVQGINSALTGINATPVASAIADVNAGLSGVDASGFDAAITSVGQTLSGVSTSGVTAAVEGINSALTGISTAPVANAIAEVNTALSGVSTEVFTTTIVSVFEGLASRISSVIGSITAERVAVREAALQIIDPTVLSKAQINAGIAGIDTTLPSNAALSAANAAVVTATQAKDARQSYLSAIAAPSTGAVDSSRAALNAANAGVAATRQTVEEYLNWYGGSIHAATSAAMSGAFYGYPDNSGERNGQDAVRAWRSAEAKVTPAQNALTTAQQQYDAMYAHYQMQVASAQDALNWANSGQAAAQEAAKKAALDYAAALQDFAIDASKSVGKLTRLREETVRYYEAQKQLADLMATSAAGLRATVDTYNYNQKSPEQQVAELQAKYATAYTTALSVQGDGSALAGQGDKLNALLGPLIDKLTETGKSNLIGSYLSQAQSIADLLEATAPKDYQQDSLAMLGSIDATLAALDASSQSAERLITNAVNAGSEKTAAGLRAVIAALTGQAVPAFALGGSHTGGLRIVGENGPELEATGPSRIFNAAQTRSMLSGGDDKVVAELRALRADNDDMRAELRAIAVASNKTAKILERVTPDGNSLQTVAA